VTKPSRLSLFAGILVAAPMAAAAEEAAPAPYEAPAPAAPTLESLHQEIEQLKASHAEQVKELRDAMAKRDEENIVASEREAMERERLLRIYGFGDFGMMRTIAPKEAQLASQFTTPLTFYLGRVNLYFDSHPDPDFRFLAETRLSLYPNGTSSVGPTGQVNYTSTWVNDVSSPNPSAGVNWGSIILERAVLDWTRHPLFSVRVGLFLTPFGIYNVDHGSPALIAATLPAYIGQVWIPERQLGVQIFGSQPVDRWELGYAATVSNGRTDGIVDVGDSKAFGGRVFARRQGEVRLLLGASALYQPYRRDREQFGVDASGNVTYTRTRVVEREALTVGIDQSLDYLGLRVRNELVLYELEYEHGLRDSPAQARGGFAPDTRQWNWECTVAYRLFDLEPYVRSDFFYVSPTQPLDTWVLAIGAGLNIYFRPNVMLKTAWTNARFHKDGDTQNLAARQNFHTFNASLVWAF
jgi:hypothetical protein